MIFLPSGLNMGKASKPLSRLIFTIPLPSKSTIYMLKGKPRLYSWLLQKMMRLESGVKLGAQLACPRSVICLALLPSAFATQTYILVGATIPSFNKSWYSLIASGVFGLLALHTIFFPSGLNHAPPS